MDSSGQIVSVSSTAVPNVARLIPASFHSLDHCEKWTQLLAPPTVGDPVFTDEEYQLWVDMISHQPILHQYECTAHQI